MHALSLYQRKSSEASNTQKLQTQTEPRQCDDFCLARGEEAASDSPMLVVVDTDIGMVSLSVCRQKEKDLIQTSSRNEVPDRPREVSERNAERARSPTTGDETGKGNPKCHNALIAPVESAWTRQPQARDQTRPNNPRGADEVGQTKDLCISCWALHMGNKGVDEPFMRSRMRGGKEVSSSTIHSETDGWSTCFVQDALEKSKS